MEFSQQWWVCTYKPVQLHICKCSMARSLLIIYPQVREETYRGIHLTSSPFSSRSCPPKGEGVKKKLFQLGSNRWVLEPMTFSPQSNHSVTVYNRIWLLSSCYVVTRQLLCGCYVVAMQYLVIFVPRQLLHPILMTGDDHTPVTYMKKNNIQQEFI